MARCCCGQFDLDPVYGPEITHNDITHQILGMKGNFCGPTYLHLENKLRARIAELEAKLKNRCGECGARLNLTGCLICGAPQCCPSCCRIDTLEAERDTLKASLISMVDTGQKLWMLECAGFYPNCGCIVCQFRRAMTEAKAAIAVKEDNGK